MTRYPILHTPRGVHATQNTANHWVYTLQDGLGSVRAEIAADTDITAMGAYEPYGVPTDVEGAYSQPFRFTGEMLDTNALQYHRARYYDAGAAQWASLDPFEGLADRAMSLNGYSWVEGNVVNGVDPSGMAMDFITQSLFSGLTGSKVNGNLCSIFQTNQIDVLLKTIQENYPVRTITRGLDVNAQQITTPFTEQQHLQILENLLAALTATNLKLELLGSSLNELFSQNEFLDIALDYSGLNGSFSGITPYDIPNRLRLGNNMTSEHIVHELGHTIDRKSTFVHSNNLSTRNIRTILKIPVTANNSISNKIESRTISGISSCRPTPVGDPIHLPFGFTIQERILSGTPPLGGEYQRCLVGYGDIANSSPDSREDWADMFMNWVFDNTSEGGNAGFSKVSQDNVVLAVLAQHRKAWMNTYMDSNF